MQINYSKTDRDRRPCPGRELSLTGGLQFPLPSLFGLGITEDPGPLVRLSLMSMYSMKLLFMSETLFVVVVFNPIRQSQHRVGFAHSTKLKMFNPFVICRLSLLDNGGFGRW